MKEGGKLPTGNLLILLGVLASLALVVYGFSELVSGGSVVLNLTLIGVGLLFGTFLQGCDNS